MPYIEFHTSKNKEFEVSDSLAKKLMAAGASKQQVNSAVVKIMLAVLADNENAFDAVSEIEGIKCNLLNELQNARNKMLAATDKQRRADEKCREYEKLLEKTKEYELSVNALETAEARDRFRLAEYFKKNILPKNVYQETEYIKGLSAILSGTTTQKAEDSKCTD